MARSKSNTCSACGTPLSYGTKGALCRVCWRTEQAPKVPLNPSGLCMCGCGQLAPLAKQSERKRGHRVGEPLRYVAGHMQLRTQEAYAVRDMGYPGGPCWVWQRHINESGYGAIRTMQGVVRAHRAMYEEAKGPIPEGMHLDHLCRVRNCVNPDHLEPVSSAENWRRGMSPAAVSVRTQRCQRGHDLSVPENVYLVKANGKRQCRVCTRMRRQARKAA